MNAFELAEKVMNFLVPVLKSKAGKKIAGDISEAVNNEGILLWNKISRIFIKEEFIKELENDPINLKAQLEMRVDMCKKFESDEIFKNEILKIFEKPAVQEAMNVITQHHSGSGDNIGRDKVVYKSEAKPRTN